MTSDMDIRLEVELDETPVRDNVCSLGDPDEDRAFEDEILERLGRGDIWAWCCVRVVVTQDGVTASSPWVGGCTYKDEAQFREYMFDDMLGEARDELHAQLAGRIHTTAREWFTLDESRALARLVYKRFGNDPDVATAAWRRLLESRSVTIEEFMRLVRGDNGGSR